MNEFVYTFLLAFWSFDFVKVVTVLTLLGLAFLFL